MTKVPAPDCVVLVGGQGTRLRSVNPRTPKPMIEFSGRPFLEWLLLLLRGEGFRRIILCTGHKAEHVSRYFGAGEKWGLDICYSREEAPLGTGGALRQAEPLLRTEQVFVCNGDSICDFEFSQLRAHHGSVGCDATIWLVGAADGCDYGAVSLDDSGIVRSFEEKPKRGGGGLVNAGLYLFDRSLICEIGAGPRSLESELFPQLVGGRLGGVVGDGRLLDIGTPQRYREATQWFAAEGAGAILGL